MAIELFVVENHGAPVRSFWSQRRVSTTVPSCRAACDFSINTHIYIYIHISWTKTIKQIQTHLVYNYIIVIDHHRLELIIMYSMSEISMLCSPAGVGIQCFGAVSNTHPRIPRMLWYGLGIGYHWIPLDILKFSGLWLNFSGQLMLF